MEKNIKDYLGLYLGCEVIGTYNDQSGSKGYLTGVTNGGYECEIQFFEEDGINVSEEPEFNEAKEIKLILRPLSDMTEEEYKHILYNLLGKDGGRDRGKSSFCEMFITIKNADIFSYCLNQGFDLFGLIESGLALDATKQLTPTSTNSK